MAVLLLSDDDELREFVTVELRAQGIAASSNSPAPKAIIVDHDMPQARDRIAALGQDRPPVLLLTTTERIASVPANVDAVALKPLRPGEVAARLRILWRRAPVSTTARERLLAHAVEYAGDIIEITSPTAHYEYVNSAFIRVLGHKLEDVVGRTPAQVIRSDKHEPEYWQRIGQLLDSGKVWHGLIISRAKDGRDVYLEGSIAPIKDVDGRITHHVAVKRDITARIESEKVLRRKSEELEQARDAAIAASRSKSQFLANMSHELRTPLNAIIGYSEMLAEDASEAGNEPLHEDLLKIQRAGEHLLLLINDVLDISKIEAGAMKLHLESFELKTALGGVIATIEPLARERKNELKVEIDDDVGVMRADLTKVRQTLLNLLSNACKFTEQGSVTLRVATREIGGQPQFVFEIIDTGIGISREQRLRLFRPFVQADTSTTRKYGGTGLGLAISQRFCQMMGGHIDVASELGKGSTFTVTLPQSVIDPDDPVPVRVAKRRSVGAGATVLVVDDDPTIRDLVGRALTKHGFSVDVARNGREGLERARELLPAAIVLDVMMPELDGWGVLTELKADSTTAEIPVVILTILEQSEVGFALGAVDYLVKPVQTDRLAAVLQRYCRASTARVLIIDDDRDSRDLMRRYLEAAGHSVSEAANGAEGIEALEALRPDLVVLDLMMPILDGFGVLAHVRKREELRSLPIVVVTAKTLTDEDREMLAGAQAVFDRTRLDRQTLLDSVVEQVSELVGE
jgi:PAS domain S-box-containing protein